MDTHSERALFGRSFVKVAACSVLAACCLPFTAHANVNESMVTEVVQQTKQISGQIVDSKGESIIGANVMEKGTTNGTITDFDGKFSLSVSPKGTLVISYIGYKTIELTADQLKANMTITLKEDTELIDEVVVIGYGTQRKGDVTSAVASVKAEDFTVGKISDAAELIKGKVAGLSITKSSGDPNATSSIMLRGITTISGSVSPLILVDGVEGSLTTVAPENIASIDVLKDASATAIYGSRASNGVIIITTKKGTQDKIKVSYSGTFTAKDPYKRIETMDAASFRQTIAQQYPTGTTVGDAAATLVGQYPEQSTNWQDEIFQTGLSTDHNIGVAGKVGFLPFRVSLGYNTEKGTLKTSDYDRYTASVNFSPKFFDKHLSVDINVKGTINKTRFADREAVAAAAFFDPTKPVYNETGRYNGYWSWENAVVSDTQTEYFHNTLSAVNPLAMLNERDNHGKTLRSLGNIQLDYKFHGLEDLHANLNLGYDVAKATGSNFVNAGSPMAAKDTDFKNVGQGNTWNNLRRNHLLDFYLNYAKDIEAIQSHFDIMAGYSWQHFYYSNHDITYSNLIEKGVKEGWTYSDEEGRYVKNGNRVIPNENYLVSFFGRLNYSFKNRYLLTATLRRDGSSRFSKNNRWGTFPSAAFAWTVLNEPWMKPVQSVMSNLKIRVGYGITGQQEIGDYKYMASYTLGTNPNGQYLGSFLLKPNGYSPDLKWEQTTTYNLGIDYGFLNNRINGSIEIYKKNTTDLLNNVSAPAGTNFSNIIIANVGEMENKGVEFNINALAINTKDFTWELGYNVTWNDSKITKLTANFNPDYPGINAGSTSFGTGNVVQKHQVGYAPSTFYVYQQVYDNNGNPIQNAVVDRDGNGEITESDKYLTGKSPMAKVFMGFSSQFTYKNWDLGFNMRANFGNYIFNGFAADNTSLNNFANQGFATNYYKDAGKYGFTQISDIIQKSTDLYLENASFLKMDNITLGYSFNKFFTSRISGRISASVQNVFTITKYTGLDPECDAIDSNVWPRPRSFTIGLNLNF